MTLQLAVRYWKSEFRPPLAARRISVRVTINQAITPHKFEQNITATRAIIDVHFTGGRDIQVTSTINNIDVWGRNTRLNHQSGIPDLFAASVPATGASVTRSFINVSTGGIVTATPVHGGLLTTRHCRGPNGLAEGEIALSVKSTRPSLRSKCRLGLDESLSKDAPFTLNPTERTLITFRVPPSYYTNFTTHCFSHYKVYKANS